MPYRQRRFDLLVIRREAERERAKNEGTLILPSKCKSQMMPDWFLYACRYICLRTKRTRNDDSLLLQHRHISSSNREDVKKNAYRPGRNFHLYLRDYTEEIWDDQKKTYAHLQKQSSTAISMP
jgi:hypothetical protein